MALLLLVLRKLGPSLTSSGTDLRTLRLAIAFQRRSNKAMHPSQVAHEATARHSLKRQQAGLEGSL